MKDRTDALNAILLLQLAMAGADIVAPKELKEAALEGLDLQDDETIQVIEKLLEKVTDSDKKLDIIQAIILTQLTPSQMMQLHNTIKTGAGAIIDYCADHPEVRKKPTLEEFKKRIFGISE